MGFNHRQLTGHINFVDVLLNCCFVFTEGDVVDAKPDNGRGHGEPRFPTPR